MKLEALECTQTYVLVVYDVVCNADGLSPRVDYYTISKTTLTPCTYAQEIALTFLSSLFYFINVTEETQSEVGDSDISDFTLVSCNNYNDKSQRKTNDVDQMFLGLNILEPEEEAVHESRQQCTAQYVLDMSDGHWRPPVCLELVEHGQRTAETSQLGSQYRGWYL